jgi:hypothetical protein
MVYVCELSYMMCMLFVDDIVLCGDKYSVCDKYMNFCVITRGGKHIRCHIWPLIGLTSVGTYHSRRKLAG